MIFYLSKDVNKHFDTMAAELMIEDFESTEDNACPAPKNEMTDHQENIISNRPTLKTTVAYQDITERSLTKDRQSDSLPSVLPLNVGGYKYMTRLSTLCKCEDSMLAAMFSGRHQLDKDPSGNYFIDSDGKHFGHVLEFLRHGSLPPMSAAMEVYREACYYNLTALQDRLQLVPEVARTIVRDAHRLQFPDYHEAKQALVRHAIDNATTNKCSEVLVYAFRKQFKAKAPNFNANHECVADTAHVRVGPWEAPPDEETLIRSLENDLIEDGFHIKTHEHKKRCQYYNGQNCQRSVYKITFIFY